MKNNKLILGVKVPVHFNVRKISPHVPIPGAETGYGLGVGLYAEVIPFRYIAMESGFYIRTFSLGDDIITYNEINIPIVFKIRFPIYDKFIFSLGGGVIYCNPFNGKIYLTLGGENEPMDIPEHDLTSNFGIIIKTGFQFMIEEIILNLDLGMECVEKPIEIEQTDFALLFGIGFGLL
jgi:hypothetical protein